MSDTKRVYTTNDYNRFKTLKGNRNVSNTRVVRIMESIQKYGWLSNPILVNDKFEIIDGQGRFEALRRLGLPIEYIVHSGIGLKECQGLNHYQKNWSMMDYINSFVESGNDNYAFLKQMLIQYRALPKYVVYSVSATKGKNRLIARGDYARSLERGELLLSKEDRKNVDDALFYLSRFDDTVAHLGGRKDNFYSAIMFLYLLDAVDNERLCKVVNNARFDGMISSGNVEGYLQQFENIYNKSLKKQNRIDFMHEFKVA